MVTNGIRFQATVLTAPETHKNVLGSITFLKRTMVEIINENERNSAQMFNFPKLTRLLIYGYFSVQEQATKLASISKVER